MTRYVSPHPLPTPHQRELLVILIEECSEVIKDATKWLRFGAKNIDHNKGDGITNDVRVAMEIGDVCAMMDKMLEQNMITSNNVRAGYRQKLEKLKTFLQTEPDA